MKRSICLCILLLLVICAWSFGPTTQEAKALKIITLTSPPDSTKETNATPTFQWQVSGGTPQEVITRFHIKLADDPGLTNPIWEDSDIVGTATNLDYPGAPPLEEWKAYYWAMRAEIDTGAVYWQDFTPTSVFFYTTAVVIEIPTNLPTIQEGIVWGAEGDTVLVRQGTYYENLRFYKNSLVVISDSLIKDGSIDTTVINRTIIDGSALTRGPDNGSVVYFSPAADSFSILMGFTIRGGTGTNVPLGIETRTSGGGIFCEAGSTPEIAYNVITGNQVQHDGGGIYINSAAPNIFHNIISNNLAVEGSGGAIECRFSIEVEASPSLNQGKHEGETSQKAASGPRLNMEEMEIKNSLNPRDGTDVASPQNDPPVPVVTWFARKNTIIQRDKYLVGDTLFFDGAGSYDPDPSDSIQFTWFLRRYYQCWRSIPTFRQKVSDTTYILPITNSQTGLLDVYLLLSDYTVSSFSDTITVSVQNPPYADAGDAVIGPPGDTLWLSGTESCDVNPDDALQYTWTNLSGPMPVSIQNPDSAVAYFVPEDPSYIGTYQFRLRVSDSMDADSVDLQVTVDQQPVPVCENDPIYGDTIVGFQPGTPGPENFYNVRLDACGSYDPDSATGDRVKYFDWECVELTTIELDGFHTLNCNAINVKDYLCNNDKVRLEFGGLYKLYLTVEDNFGLESEGYDSVFISVQLLALADAGRDTIVRPSKTAHLFGRALDMNPDQRESTEFTWRWIELPPVPPPSIKPSSTDDTVYFTPPTSGIYRLALTVNDGFGISLKDDKVVVVANQPPQAYVVNVDHAFEGDTVYLDGSGSYDIDSAKFIDPDDTTYTEPWVQFTWSVTSNYPGGAQAPVLLDANQPIAKFVPYAAGSYTFRLLVNDTLSVHQPPDSVRTPTGSDTLANIVFLEVNVDSTYAYPIIQGNLIYGNSAGSKGGAIDCNGSSPDIISNVFYKNQSRLSGGAVCARNASTPQIMSNVFFGNISSDSTGGAIANLGALTAPSATRGFRKDMAIQYNDFWDNGGGAMYQTSGNISDNIFSFPRLYDPDFGDFSYECSSDVFDAGDPLHPDIGELVFFPGCVTADTLNMVALSLFQNPVATAAAHFIVNTDVPLKGYPVGYVTIGGNAPSPVYFSPIASKTFRGSFVFTASGSAEVSIFASSLLERDTVVVDTLSVQLIGAGKTGKLVSADGKVGVLFADGSVKEEIYATCISVSKDSRYDFEGDPEMEAFGEPYQLGPSISFDKDLTVSFSLGHFDLEGKDKTLFSVYRYEDGEWNRLESYPDGDRVCAEAKTLGVFRLIHDPNAKPLTNIPQTYQLFQNYPNPFNPETQIKYDLPVSGNVKLSVYNVLGQRVRVLVDGIQDAGHRSVAWDGRDNDGREVASGIYFYKIKAENYQKTKKMVLLK